jgi:hypothetical protein
LEPDKIKVAFLRGLTGNALVNYYLSLLFRVANSILVTPPSTSKLRLVRGGSADALAKVGEYYSYLKCPNSTSNVLTRSLGAP